MSDDKTICFCMSVKESQIIDAIKKNKLKTVEEVSKITKYLLYKRYLMILINKIVVRGGKIYVGIY